MIVICTRGKAKHHQKEKKNTKMLAKGERAYSLVDERQRGKRRLRQGEKLNFRCRKARETRPLYVEAEPEPKKFVVVYRQ
ncbi:hypothetical protein TNCV_3549211 [Trichonephila clavipes]|nr:hypothetical protein TNCV_3549211 [Trichonephila clavipes]